MSFRYGNLRDYVKNYTMKTKDYRTRFKSYIKAHRERIIARQRQKFRKRLIFWSVFLGGGYFIYDEIYRKQIQISKMNSKLQNFYSKNMVRQDLKQGVYCIILSPQTLDQLANMMSLAYKYHYKVIVRMDQITKRQKIIISEQFDNKCIFLNISCLNKSNIDEVNSQLYIETGAKCVEVNQMLQKNGYEALFPIQFQKQTVYDIIIKNLPLNQAEVSQVLINMELISSSGIHFRSSSQTNRYGQIPSLNPLFIGTGGIFAIPTAANMRITRKQKEITNQETLLLKIENLSERIIALYNFTQANLNLIDIKQTKLSNILNNNTQFNHTYLTCKDKYPLKEQNLNQCSKIANKYNIPIEIINKQSSEHIREREGRERKKFHLLFNVNNRIFQQFLIKYHQVVAYQYVNGILKVCVNNPDNQDQYINIINSITNSNGIFVWCDIPQILMRIKPSLDSLEVGAQLMRKIVQVRQGLDRRNILYAHNRYEHYFAKGFFRRMTEYFW